jgi:uncharacterized protein YeeX (DUF496 family)
MKLEVMKELRNTKKLRRDLEREKELIITRNGKPYFLISLIKGQNIEDVLSFVRKFRAFQAVEALQEQSVVEGKDEMSSKEIEKIISKVRKDYK